MIGFGSFLIAAALVAPSFAAKKAVTDEELDMVTAAGQPVVVQTGGASTVSFIGTTVIVSDLLTNSQTTLRALILNNVVGENQVHNGVNVNSLGLSAGSQANTITQSWGSILDIDARTAAGATATAVPDCGSALICKGNAVASAVSGTVQVLSKAADHIIDVGDGSTVTYQPITSIAADLSNDSQTNLTALIVNNVTGLNQVATGVNIAGGSLNLESALLTVSAQGGTNTGQANAISQFRGTPGNFR
jgi:hypothetical protein